MAESTKDVAHRFDRQVESHLASIVIDSEYETVKSDNGRGNTEFELIIDMLECKRSAKDYDWMSDVFIPELPAVVLSEAADWANQEFRTRDFVECKLEGDEPGNKEKARAAKKCINETLNRRGLFYFPKYIRARTINSLRGSVYAVCWWEQDIKPVVVGKERRIVPLDVDVLGRPMMDIRSQIPATRVEERPVWGEKIIVDQFNFDVVDPRNVFTPNTYDYSPQTKPWITVRAERTYEELVAEAGDRGYFNLDLVMDLNPPVETQTSKESYNRDDQQPKPDKTPGKPFDILTRFGKMWINDNGDPGYDERGEPTEGSRFVECITTFVVSDSTRILIGFKEQELKDGYGNPFRPIVRGQCYIHPTKDSGLSDGQNVKELQKALNDTFNMAADRTKLSTTPTLKGRKYALEDNTTIYFEPEHVMELENPETDLVEFKIQDDIQGALSQMGMLKDSIYQVTARFPSTMGALPSESSTTATAVAGAESRTSGRSNYKSLTFENTFSLDFYWMILQLTAQFAHPRTMMKLMGQDWTLFDPNPDYSYSPLQSNVEAEQNKYRKLQTLDQMMGRLVGFPNPKTPIVLNMMLSKAFELMGSEYSEYKDALLDESPKAVDMLMNAQGRNPQMPETNGNPMSNQIGMPQTGQEQFARGGMSQ